MVLEVIFELNALPFHLIHLEVWPLSNSDFKQAWLLQAVTNELLQISETDPIQKELVVKRMVANLDKLLELVVVMAVAIQTLRNVKIAQTQLQTVVLVEV